MVAELHRNSANHPSFFKPKGNHRKLDGQFLDYPVDLLGTEPDEKVAKILLPRGDATREALPGVAKLAAQRPLQALRLGGIATGPA
jgi:hypothetical protein